MPLTANWMGRFIKSAPVIITLVVLIVGAVAGYTTVQVTQRAHAGDLMKIQKTQNFFRLRVRSLESNQAAMKERLDAIHQEQRAATVRQAAGRREILDAITGLGNRITNR